MISLVANMTSRWLCFFSPFILFWMVSGSLGWKSLLEGHLGCKRKCTLRQAARPFAIEEAHRCSFPELERDPIKALAGFQSSA